MADRKCHYCSRGSITDSRVGHRQRVCSVEWQRFRKRENDRVFREKNSECGRAPERYAYLKEWRRKHPDDQRRWREANKEERSSGEIKVLIVEAQNRFHRPFSCNSFCLCALKRVIIMPYRRRRGTPSFFLLTKNEYLLDFYV